jgi:hypothetical protein
MSKVDDYDSVRFLAFLAFYPLLMRPACLPEKTKSVPHQEIRHVSIVPIAQSSHSALKNTVSNATAKTHRIAANDKIDSVAAGAFNPKNLQLECDS